MKASALEFRLRYWLHTLVFGLGFFAPWNYALHLDPTGANAHAWGVLSAEIGKTGVMTIGTAFDGLLIIGIVVAAAGAWLRTWGSAYLGAAVVEDGRMHAGIVADGPYRHMRNPLYVGTWLHSVALALLMPVSGAVFVLVVIGVMQVRLILGEEAFLGETLGAAYAAYRAKVPRVWPAVRARVAAAGRVPRWGQALASEVYFWGVAAAFAALGWSYNAQLLLQAVLVSFGVSLVMRAVVPKERVVAVG